MRFFLMSSTVIFGLAIFSQPVISEDDSFFKPGHSMNPELQVVVSESRKVIAAYSRKTATWSHIELTSPLEKDSVVFGAAVVVCTTDEEVCAFKAETGKWTVLKLRDDAQPVAKIGHWIEVIDRDHLYTFGFDAIRWSGVDVKSGIPLPLGFDSPQQAR